MKGPVKFCYLWPNYLYRAKFISNMIDKFFSCLTRSLLTFFKYNKSFLNVKKSWIELDKDAFNWENWRQKSGLFYTRSYLDKFFNIPLEAHLFSLQILTISRHSLMPRGTKLLNKNALKSVLCRMGFNDVITKFKLLTLDNRK